MKILVVDDDLFVRKSVVRVLKSLGQEVLEAENGEMGLVILGQQFVDMLITDYQMPGMNGLELIALARKKIPQLKVIITSGGGLNLENIPTDVPFLPKPVSLNDLEKTIKEAQ